MTQSANTLRLELSRGIYGRVAAELGLGPSGRSHVWRVSKGQRRSPRVQQALAAEWARIDRAVKLYERTLRRQEQVAA